MEFLTGIIDCFVSIDAFFEQNESICAGIPFRKCSLIFDWVIVDCPQNSHPRGNMPLTWDVG